jgi:hypothetical protein
MNRLPKSSGCRHDMHQLGGMIHQPLRAGAEPWVRVFIFSSLPHSLVYC